MSPRSLFILSNETVNIWSHLLGFVLFFTLGIYDLTAVLPAAGASREDFVICSVCLFCFQVGPGRPLPRRPGSAAREESVAARWRCLRRPRHGWDCRARQAGVRPGRARSKSLCF